MEATLEIRVRMRQVREANQQLRSLQQTTGQLGGATARMASAMQGRGGVVGAIGGMAAGVTMARQKVRGFFNNLGSGLYSMEKFGKNLQWTGRQIEFNFTLPIVAAGIATSRWALELDRAQVRMAKVYGDLSIDQETARAEVEALQEAFRHLSDIFGVHQSEVTEIAAAWAQAGAGGTALAHGVRTTLEVMILGTMEASESIDALIAVQAQYNLSAQELIETMAILNMVENNTTIAFRNLIEVLQKSGGIAREAGVDVRHLAAMAASLVPAAGNASEAGNALKTIITRLMAPASAANDLFEEMGIAVSGVEWQSGNFVERLEILGSALDDVNTAQRNVALTHIFGRRQVSRAAILIRDFTADQGRYATALAVTADEARNMAQYHQEVAMVLQSTSKGFDIVSAQLRNALIDVITPMLPAMLGLIHRFVGLVQAFGQLHPVTQQWILLSLAMLAVMGPIIRTVGAAILVFNRLGAVILFFAKSLALLALKVLSPWTIAIGGIAFLIWALRDNMGQAVESMERIWMRLPETVRNVLTAVIDMVATAARIIRDFFSNLFSIGGPTSSNVGRRKPQTPGGGVQHMHRGGKVPGQGRGDKIPALLEPEEFVVRRDGSNLVDALAFFNAPGFQGGGPVAAAERILLQFQAATASARQALLRQERAETREMIVAVAPGAGSAVDAMFAAIDRLNAEMERLSREIRAQESIVARWQKALDEANRRVDAAQDRLRGMRDRLSELRDAAQAAESAYRDAASVLDELTRTPIEGMREMSDALFENEMAQKELRLELMRLEEAHGSIDDTQRKLARLQGELEKMRGKREDLRLAGAGSDILGVVDRQIAELEGAKAEVRAGTGPHAEMQALREEIERLRREGEMLRLEESLRFDPLRRQIDQLVNSMEEMSFEELLARIIEQQREVDKLEGEWRRAEQAVADQEAVVAAQEAVVAGLERQRDSVRERYDLELAKLQQLNERYRSSEGMVRQMESALRELERAAAAAQAAMEAAARAAEAAKGAGADEILPPHVERFREAGIGVDFELPGGEAMLGHEGGLDEINELIDQWAEEAAQTLGSLDFFGPLKDAWATAIRWLKRRWNDFVTWWNGLTFGDGPFGGVTDFFQGLRPLMAGLANLFTSTFEVIATVIEGFAVMFGTIWSHIREPIGSLISELGNWVEMFGNFFSSIVVAMEPLGPLFHDMFIPLMKGIGDTIGPILGFVINLFTNLLAIVRHVIQGIVALVERDFMGVWESIVGITDAIHKTFSDMWDMIVALFGDAFWMVAELFQKIADAIFAPFRWVYDRLVGNSLVPDMVNAIVGYFTFLFDRGRAIFNNIRDTLVQIVTAIRDRIESIIDALSRWWTTTWGTIRDRAITPFTAMRDFILGAASAVSSFVRETIGSLSTWWSTTWSTIRTNATSPITSARDTIIEVINRVNSVFRDVFNALGSWWGGFWDGIQRAISTPLGAVESTVERITGNIRRAFDTMSSGVETAMDALKGAMSRPVNWVINNAYNNGIRRFWNAIASRIGVGQMARIDPIRLATGGRVPGVGSGDRVPALLEPGEWVLNKRSSQVIDDKFLQWLNSLGSSADFYRGLRTTGGDLSEVQRLQSGGWVKDPSEVIAEGRRRTGRYQWGGFGNPGFDCSGFMAWLSNFAATGNGRMGGRWATGMATGRNRVGRFAPGRGDPSTGFSIGINTAGHTPYGRPGHTAGTVAGTNVESAGGIGSHVGGRRGWSYGAFRYHLPDYGMDSRLRRIASEVWDLIRGIDTTVGDQAWQKSMRAATHLGRETLGYGLERVPFGSAIRRAIGLQHGALVKSRPGGTLALIGEGGSDEAVIPLSDEVLRKLGGGTHEHHYHGDFVFPNITSGEDAEEFIKNLERIVT